MYSANGKNRAHSGQGHAVSNIIVFVVLFAILVAGFYLTSWAELNSFARGFWPMIAVIGGGMLCFGLGMHLFGRSDNNPTATANEAHAVAQVDAEYAAALKESARKH